MIKNDNLIHKYNVPGPRYTSYPTVPFWKEKDLDGETYLSSIQHNIDFFQSKKVSIYIHLPFCESMCTFCGCHKRVTKNHAVENPYIEALLNEWSIYKKRFDLEIKEIHLGGGTPTFFSPEALQLLIEKLIENQDLEDVEFSFEAHPNNTTEKHLQVLFNLGFKRLSFGVQDYDPIVQKAIHRFQPVEKVREVHQLAKKIGYPSISHDLVYGLPKQTLAGILNTVEETIKIKPERVSLYSYAHVPWIKGNGQRGFDENDLPDNEEKRALYENAKKRFLDAGYIEIGMDHFALPSDDMSIAFKNKSLHRNFMGYTTQKTNLLLGLGASSISDSWFAFAQNEKNIEAYMENVNSGKLALTKGHFLSAEDLILRKNILDLMCQFQTVLPSNENLKNKIVKRLNSLKEDGLVQISENIVSVTQLGLPFIRNVCMAFDGYLYQKNDFMSSEKLFSKTI